jgi:hypothetical protein
MQSVITVNEKKRHPGAILTRRNASSVIKKKLHGFYVFRCRAFLTLRNIETDALALG